MLLDSVLRTAARLAWLCSCYPPSADGALKGYNLELAKGFEPPTL